MAESASAGYIRSRIKPHVERLWQAMTGYGNIVVVPEARPRLSLNINVIGVLHSNFGVASIYNYTYGETA